LWHLQLQESRNEEARDGNVLHVCSRRHSDVRGVHVAGTKINDDGTVTGTKAKGGKGGGGGIFGKGEAVTVKIAKDVKVFKGKYDKEARAR